MIVFVCWILFFTFLTSAVEIYYKIYKVLEDLDLTPEYDDDKLFGTDKPEKGFLLYKGALRVITCSLQFIVFSTFFWYSNKYHKFEFR